MKCHTIRFLVSGIYQIIPRFGGFFKKIIDLSYAELHCYNYSGVKPCLPSGVNPYLITVSFFCTVLQPGLLRGPGGIPGKRHKL